MLYDKSGVQEMACTGFRQNGARLRYLIADVFCYKSIKIPEEYNMFNQCYLRARGWSDGSHGHEMITHRISEASLVFYKA